MAGSSTANVSMITALAWLELVLMIIAVHVGIYFLIRLYYIRRRLDIIPRRPRLLLLSGASLLSGIAILVLESTSACIGGYKVNETLFWSIRYARMPLVNGSYIVRSLTLLVKCRSSLHTKVPPMLTNERNQAMLLMSLAAGLFVPVAILMVHFCERRGNVMDLLRVFNTMAVVILLIILPHLSNVNDMFNIRRELGVVITLTIGLGFVSYAIYNEAKNRPDTLWPHVKTWTTSSATYNLPILCQSITFIVSNVIPVLASTRWRKKLGMKSTIRERSRATRQHRSSSRKHKDMRSVVPLDPRLKRHIGCDALVSGSTPRIDGDNIPNTSTRAATAAAPSPLASSLPVSSHLQRRLAMRRMLKRIAKAWKHFFSDTHSSDLSAKAMSSRGASSSRRGAVTSHSDLSNNDYDYYNDDDDDDDDYFNHDEDGDRLSAMLQKGTQRVLRRSVGMTDGGAGASSSSTNLATCATAPSPPRASLFIANPNAKRDAFGRQSGRLTSSSNDGSSGTDHHKDIEAAQRFPRKSNILVIPEDGGGGDNGGGSGGGVGRDGRGGPLASHSRRCKGKYRRRGEWNFKSIRREPLILEAFKGFVCSALCEESLLFLMAVMDYRSAARWKLDLDSSSTSAIATPGATTTTIITACTHNIKTVNGGPPATLSGEKLHKQDTVTRIKAADVLEDNYAAYCSIIERFIIENARYEVNVSATDKNAAMVPYYHDNYRTLPSDVRRGIFDRIFDDVEELLEKNLLLPFLQSTNYKHALETTRAILANSKSRASRNKSLASSSHHRGDYTD